MTRVLNRADARKEVEHVAAEDEKKDGHEKREETPRHFSALKRLGHIVVDEHERLFEKRLQAPGYHRKAASDEECKPDQDCYHHPACDECIRDRNTQKFSEFLGGKSHVNPLFHCRDSSIFDLFHPTPNCPCDLLFRPAEQVPRAGNDDCFALLKVFFE